MPEDKSKQLIEKIKGLHQQHCNSDNQDAMPVSRKPPGTVPGRSVQK